MTLKAFTDEEYKLALNLLAAKVATMLGRKMEEGDWDFVYCNSKKIPQTEWSNLHIDINYNGLGVEHKMIRHKGKRGPIKNLCGTTIMHPSATRSIRIPDEDDPNKAMIDILNQYGHLIKERTLKVQETSLGNNKADMRSGWLIWSDNLDEFLYFEEKMVIPDPNTFFAEWNTTPPRGSRKGTKSLWVFDKGTNKKRYSITTTAGAKIQPYFDVPPPGDPNLYYFRVQSIILQNGDVQIWVSRNTAKFLKNYLGSLDSEVISKSILSIQNSFTNVELVEERDISFTKPSDIAIPITISSKAYRHLKDLYDVQGDQNLLQGFINDLE